MWDLRFLGLGSEVWGLQELRLESWVKGVGLWASKSVGLGFRV